jgi:hypothetical protein
LVLKLHLAAQRNDAYMMNLLKEQIALIQINDESLKKAVAAINIGNYSLALAYEADALLKSAA